MFIRICLELKIPEILTQNIPAEHFVAFSTDSGVSIHVIFCSTKARPQTQRTDRSTPFLLPNKNPLNKTPWNNIFYYLFLDK